MSDTIHIQIDRADGSLQRLIGLVERRGFHIDGINMADGTQCTVTIWEAVLSPDSEFDFLASEFGTVNLTGRLKTPVGKDAPYEVLIQDPVA